MSEIIIIIAMVVYQSLKFDRNRFQSRRYQVSYLCSAWSAFLVEIFTLPQIPSEWEHQASLEVLQPPSTAQGNENDTDRDYI